MNYLNRPLSGVFLSMIYSTKSLENVYIDIKQSKDRQNIHL